jgi:methionyl-tRNA synthetase
MDEEMKGKILQAVDEVEKLMDGLELTKALERAFSLASLGNEYFQSRQPWRGGPGSGDCLLTSINLLKTLCVLLYPFMPSSCTKLAEMGGFKVESWEQAKTLDLAPGHLIGKPEPLFQKVLHRTEGGGGVSYEEFMKLDLRVAEVEAAERVEGSDKLLKLTLRLDGQRRTVVAGIGRKYKPEELVGKQVALVANLEPRKIMGITSQGMILAAGETEEEVSLLVPDRKVKPNTRIR